MTTSTSRRSSSSAWSIPTAAGPVRVLASTRSDGDFHLDRVPAAELEERRRRLVDMPWTMLDERHGTDVVVVDRPGGGDRAIGDVAITGLAGVALGVWVGDCAPIVLVHPDGTFGVVHAGWRGLAQGVLESACESLGIDVGVGAVAHLGPTIGPCCYAFGADDLAAVAAAVGVEPDVVASTTNRGATALDVVAAVRHGLARRGVAVDHDAPCTGCGGSYFSHRVRADLERHVVVAWRSP